jgi:hypothetical protein
LRANLLNESRLRLIAVGWHTMPAAEQFNAQWTCHVQG